MKRVIILAIFILIFGSLIYLAAFNKQSAQGADFDETRQQVIADLDSAIAEAVETGDYHCCITPPCTMCYLGNWVFKDGKCNCDEMIATGQLDKVCPQCHNGIEEGTCSSSASTEDLGCEIDQ